MKDKIRTLIVERDRCNSDVYARYLIGKFGRDSADVANSSDSAVRLLQRSAETGNHYLYSIIGRPVPWRADFGASELFDLVEHMSNSRIPYDHILILHPKIEVSDALKKKGVILYDGNGHKVCEELKSIDDFLSRKNDSSSPQQHNQ